MTLDEARFMRRCRRTWLPILAAGLTVLGARGAEAEELPEPGAPGSHASFVQHLRDSEARAFQELLGRYDAFARAHPDDVAVQIERCRFLAAASCDEYDECRYTAESERCQAELETSFPEDPEVRLYRLEGKWGDGAIREARLLLETQAPQWDERQRARLHQKLAELYNLQESSAEVAEHAQLALQLDPELDLSLLYARSLRQLGRSAEAIAVLVERAALPSEYWLESQKIALLHELGADAEAARALDALVVPEDSYPDHLTHARIWSQAGEIDKARAALTRAEESDTLRWRSAEIQRERFRLELAYGSPASAIAYYETFRDAGYLTDPFLKHRLRLAVVYPEAPWQARDGLGALGILGLIAGLACLPLGLILPIHYAGLLRARTRRNRYPQPTDWRLRHCWYGLGLFFVAGLPFLFLDGVPLLDDLVARFSGERPLGVRVDAIPDQSLALGAVTAVFIALIGLLPVLGRGDRTLFGLGGWTLARTLGSAAIGLLIVDAICLLTMPDAFGGAFRSTPFGAPSAVFVNEMCRAIADLWGTPALFVFGAFAIPLVEELLFRGILLEGFRRHLGFAGANLAQASVFALLHESWLAFPFLMTLGLVAGWLVRRSGSLVSPVLLHASHNGLVFLFMTLGAR